MVYQAPSTCELFNFSLKISLVLTNVRNVKHTFYFLLKIIFVNYVLFAGTGKTS